jgi:hypothetical protein
MTSNNAPRVPSAVPIDDSPAARIAHAVKALGEAEVIERATALLGGLNAGEEFLLYAGGRHAQGLLDGAPPLYWPELWGARVFLYVWNDSASYAVRAGLGNQAWRVREMCAKVVAERLIACPDQLAEIATDEVARVRAQAARALGVVGTAEHRGILKPLLKDPDIDVRRQAGAALQALTERVGPEAPTAEAPADDAAAATPTAEQTEAPVAETPSE